MFSAISTKLSKIHPVGWSPVPAPLKKDTEKKAGSIRIHSNSLPSLNVDTLKITSLDMGNRYLRGHHTAVFRSDSEMCYYSDWATGPGASRATVPGEYVLNITTPDSDEKHWGAAEILKFYRLPANLLITPLSLQSSSEYHEFYLEQKSESCSWRLAPVMADVSQWAIYFMNDGGSSQLCTMPSQSFIVSVPENEFLTFGLQDNYLVANNEILSTIPRMGNETMRISFTGAEMYGNPKPVDGAAVIRIQESCVSSPFYDEVKNSFSPFIIAGIVIGTAILGFTLVTLSRFFRSSASVEKDILDNYERLTPGSKERLRKALESRGDETRAVALVPLLEDNGRVSDGS